MVSAIVFNFILFFKSPVAEIENPSTGPSANADVLEAQSILTGIINSFSCPTFVTFVFLHKHDPAYEVLGDEIKEFTWYMWYLQLSQTFIILFVTFVNYSQFRLFEDWRRYNRYMPYVHYWATFSIFYIFPCFFVFLNIYGVVTTDLNNSWLGPWFSLFTVTCFPLIFWYDNTIYGVCEFLR